MKKTIQIFYKKTRSFSNHHSAKIILFLTVVLLTLISFGLGYIVAKYQEKTPLQVIKDDVALKQSISSGFEKLIIYSFKG